jgi:hypothetical protein
MVKKSHAIELEPNPVEPSGKLIRQRAYNLYEQRGREDGHDLEDWFRAEAEIFGKKAGETETTPKETAAGAAA